MYRTCVVHAPIPCSVMDQDRKLYMVHDRYLADWEYEALTDATATDQEDAQRSEDG